MKRIVPLFLLALALAVAAGVALAARGSGGGPQGRLIHVIEHATTDAVTNHANGSADSVGDLLTFSNEVFDDSNAKHSGHDQGFCIRTIVGKAWECWWTTFLAGGQVTVEGPFYDTHDSRLAITGGTKGFAGARGWMELKSRAGGTQYDFTFHVIG
ncbi:MAG: allene oxide cyclase family protein [Gaiellaceae bacterium]